MPATKLTFFYLSAILAGNGQTRMNIEGVRSMKIGRTVRRTRKREFNKSNPLPKKLEFLEAIQFYAVTECIPPDGTEKQLRIEMLPSSMKKIVSGYLELENAQTNNTELEETLSKAKQVFQEQEEYIERLEQANDQLMKNLGDGPETPKSPYKSYLQVAEEIGFISHGLPVQGGLPSLGKKD